MPHRKVMREWLIPLSERTTLRAIVLLVVDYVLWAALMAGTVLFEAWWAKLLSGVAAGFVIGRLFILGHDACHQSLTPHRNLNKWLGRIAFLPSLTAYSLWDIGHNVVHHGYTNLKGFDFVWAPTHARRIRSPAFKRAYQRPHLPQRLGTRPVLHDRNLVEQDGVPQRKKHAYTSPHLHERLLAHL
jgi:fatty acid desaturase